MDQSGTITTLSGRYRLEERIGSGGAGEVWRALDTSLARRVAIKLLHPSLQHDEQTVERFKREAASAAALNHPNVVVIYDVGHDHDRDYLVMEYVDGAPLSDALREAPLPPGTVAALGAQLADALASAHALGMIHRDIKPANVILSRDGAAKLADFGIAKAVGDAQTRLTAVGTVVGSAAYVAPEQLRDGPVDQRADIYALGLLLFECATGERPFGRGTPTEVAARRLTDDPPAPRDVRPDLPAAFDEAIVRATHLDPDLRFASVTAFGQVLAALAPDDGVQRLATLARRVAPEQPVQTAVLPQEERYGETALDASATVQLAPIATTEAATAQTTAPQPAVAPQPTPPPAPPAVAPAPPRSPKVTTAPSSSPAASDESPGDRTRWVAGGLLAAAIVGVLALSGGGDATPPAEGEPAAGPYAVAGAQDFDPFGGGSEHRDEVPLAYDGNAATAWTTERYNRPNMGGLKPGTGIWFDLGEPAAVAAVNLTLGAVVDVQVFAGTTPPQGDPNAWGTLVGTVADASGDLALEVPDDLDAQYFLVWITKVPQGRGAVSEVSFARR